jgi:signal transduction histidine kinase
VLDNGASAAGALAERVPLAAPSGGRGMANIRRRAESLKARLQVGPQEQGWGVNVSIPLE